MILKEQRKQILSEFEFFIDMTELEQRYHTGHILPSVEAYQKRRMGTSGVGICLSMTE